MSDVRSANGHVTGALVIRGVDPAKIDTTQVIARVDGKSAEVKLSPATTQPRSTMLVIDTSGSMGAAGMSTVRAAVKDFLAQVPPDVKVGVVSFASTAGVDLKPTTDHKKVQSVVNGLRAKGETSLYEGVQKGVAALGTEGERSIVLLSDGEDTVAENDGGAANEKSQRAAAVRALQQGKVRAEVVAFKNDAGQAVLKAFARAGGGTVVSAADREAVKTAFDTAAQTLQSQVRFDITVPTGLTGIYDVALDGSADGQDFSTVQRVDVTASEPVVDESAVGALPDGVTTARRPEATDGVDLRCLPADRPGDHAPGRLHHRPLHVRAGVPVAPQGAPRRDRRVRHRGRRLGARTQGTNHSQLSEQLIQMGDRVMSGRESTTKTMRRIERADLPWRAGEWFLIRFVSLVIGIVAFTLVLGGKSLLIAIPLGVLVGLLFPVMALRYLANRRAKKFEAVLPDVMMLVATSLSSGFSLLQALDSVARDAAEPAAKEFSRALAESRIGSDISDALEHVADPDGEREHALGRDGDPHPARGGWQPRRHPAHHGGHAARARDAQASRPGAVRRRTPVGVHPHRPAARCAARSRCGATTSTSASCGRPSRGSSCPSWASWRCCSASGG